MTEDEELQATTLVNPVDRERLVERLSWAQDIMRLETRSASAPRLLHPLPSGGLCRLPIERGIEVGRGDPGTPWCEDRALSRHHFRIDVHGPDCVLMDSSKNGTRVNRDLVKRRALVDGDVIFAGEQVFLFLEE